jgi:hypothetical protein
VHTRSKSKSVVKLNNIRGDASRHLKNKNTRGFFQIPEIALLFIIISGNLATYGIMASPPNYKIDPAMPCGPSDFFFTIVDKRFLIMVILMVNSLLDCVD